MAAKKKVKLLKIGGGAGINIPKVAMELMGMNIGDKIQLEFDFKKNKITLTKVEE